MFRGPWVWKMILSDILVLYGELRHFIEVPESGPKPGVTGDLDVVALEGTSTEVSF